ncbi:MAG: polysaccharide pyruvyl transferase family protein, partial [Acidimicrobiia bacterium]
LGTALAVGDVIVYLDADCIPGPNLLETMLDWHRRASNLVVIGARRHVNAEGVEAGQIADGQVDLDALPWVDGPTDEEPPLPQDWRYVFYRRSRQALLGDAAFRAAVGSNLSVWKHRVVEVGGFSERFKAWGGEDTELAWRLWNDGAFFVPENRAVVHHQVRPDEDRSWRQEARQLILPLVADLVPHPFYRKAPTPLAPVPKLSWLALVESPEEADRVTAMVGRNPVADVELLLVGPPEATERHRSRTMPGGRVSVFDGEDRVAPAILAARGELTLIIDGRASFLGGIVPKALDRFDNDPRLGLVRVSYELDSGARYRRLDDLIEVDAVVGRSGLPLWAMVRTRELRKDRQFGGDAHHAWRETVGRCRTEFLMHHRAAVEASGPSSRLPGPADAASVPLGLVITDIARRARRGSPESPPTKQTKTAPAAVEYVGFTDHENLGDEAVLLAIRELMPWAVIDRNVDHPRMLMLGGGTLVNGGRYYLNRILRQDSPALDRAVFGVGVRDPKLHGITEPMEEWWSFFSSSVYVGVRGPESARLLRELGYKGDVEITGDPALSLRPATNVQRVEGRIVVCPVWTDGNLLGNDETVFAALAEEIGRLHAEGREIVMLSAFPRDDRHLIGLMRRAGTPEMPYVAGYADVRATLDLLASSDLVIAERLHAAILGAAAEVPFVALEYWPKVSDFARSLHLERFVVPTEGITGSRLRTTVTEALAQRDEVSGVISEEVGRYRRIQENAARRIQLAVEDRSESEDHQEQIRGP